MGLGGGGKEGGIVLLVFFFLCTEGVCTGWLGYIVMYIFVIFLGLGVVVAKKVGVHSSVFFFCAHRRCVQGWGT